MIVSAKVVKVGNNIDTDVILPGKYLVLTDPEELAKHAMEGIDPSFAQKVKDGAILVAGENFGCGSSREQAPMALKHSGVKCILAEFFARIFYRNAINIGLPAIEYRDISKIVDEGDLLTIDLKSGTITNHTKKVVLNFQPIPKFLLEILELEGLIEKLKQEVKKGF
ncbi:MAG: 3-isopropylmalate dehydratase small subunit [Candidatus Bathyarchaeia archaeon]